MRIGVLDYANAGRRSGVERYALGLIRCLAARIAPGDLIVYTNDADAVSLAHPGIVIRRIPGRRLRGLRLLYQHLLLPRQAEVDGLDVLHCAAYVMPLRPSRVPCVVTVHDLHALSQPQWCSFANRLHYGRMLPRSLRLAAGVIAVSQDTRESILRRFGPLRDDIRVIPPGIDDIFTDARDAAADDDCRRRHRLPDRYVLHVGNVEPRKNIPAAVAAMCRLREESLPHKLVLVGQTRRASLSLRRVISDARRQGVVQALGYVARADLPALYRMADAFLSVSHHEGFGFPALEAMACGTPVISSMTGAMAETLGDAATAVDAGNVQAVADGIATVLADPALRDRMRRAGLERAAGFRWERSADSLLQTYRQAAARRQDPGGPP